MTKIAEFGGTSFLANDLIETPYCKECIHERIQYLKEDICQAREVTERLLDMDIFNNINQDSESEVLSDFRKRLVLIRRHLVLEQKQVRDALAPGFFPTSPHWHKRRIEGSLSRIREEAISSKVLSDRLGIGACYYYSSDMPDVILVRAFEELTYLENVLHERELYGWPI